MTTRPGAPRRRNRHVDAFRFDSLEDRLQRIVERGSDSVIKKAKQLIRDRKLGSMAKS